MTVSEEWKKNSQVHTRWIIFNLVAIIIFLISFKTQNQSEIKDIINTSLALASLLLAFVAIIQALLAGHEMGRVAGDIKSSVEEIRDPASKILMAAEALKTNSERVDTSAAELSRRLDTINNPAPKNASLEGASPNADEDFYLTYGGTIALYICYLSLHQNKSFKVDNILDKEYLTSHKYISGYVTGFISCLKTTEALSITATNENFQVTDLKNFLQVSEQEIVTIPENFVAYRTEVERYFQQQNETK